MSSPSVYFSFGVKGIFCPGSYEFSEARVYRLPAEPGSSLWISHAFPQRPVVDAEVWHAALLVRRARQTALHHLLPGDGCAVCGEEDLTAGRLALQLCHERVDASSRRIFIVHQVHLHMAVDKRGGFVGRYAGGRSREQEAMLCIDSNQNTQTTAHTRAHTHRE